MGLGTRQSVDLVHNLGQRRKAFTGPILAARRQIALGHDQFECRATAGDAALDGADGSIADPRRLLIGKAAGTDQDKRLALRLRQLQQAAFQVAEFELAVLPGGCR